MMMPFESFTPGDVVVCGRFQPSAQDLQAFADATGFGDQHDAAMRWLVMSLQLRAIVDELLNRSPGQGAPGLERVDWGALVRPDDTLTVRREILETRTSVKRPEIGLARFRFDTLNQQDELALSVSQWMMFRRNAAPAPMTATSGDPPRYSAPFGEHRLMREPDPWREWCRVEPGAVARLGSYRFEADDIIAFAKAFDPQPFHVDPEAAKHSLFGQLCASGLQTMVVWAALAQDSRWEVQPSNLRHLRWHRPVQAGETLHYRSVASALRPDADEPGLTWITRTHQGLDTGGRPAIELEDEVGVREHRWNQLSM